MREDDMLRLSLECARLAVRGEDFAPVLASGAEKIMNSDAGVGVITWPLINSNDPMDRVRVVVSGIPPVNDSYIAGAVEVAARHPSFRSPTWFNSPTSRVSDFVLPNKFWDTDVWLRMHGHADARYPAAVNFGCPGGVATFLGVQRSRKDFSDEDMQVLDLVRGPLVPALAFRQAWDRAAQRLQCTSTGSVADRFTRREAEVLALVARGWTNRHIGHHLGITERTVRRHLENVNAKLGVSSRTAAATLWQGQLDPSF